MTKAQPTHPTIHSSTTPLARSSCSSRRCRWPRRQRRSGPPCSIAARTAASTLAALLRQRCFVAVFTTSPPLFLDTSTTTHPPRHLTNLQPHLTRLHRRTTATRPPSPLWRGAFLEREKTISGGEKKTFLALCLLRLRPSRLPPKPAARYYFRLPRHFERPRIAAAAFDFAAKQNELLDNSALPLDGRQSGSCSKA